jgi:hypothetical protein
VLYEEDKGSPKSDHFNAYAEDWAFFGSTSMTTTYLYDTGNATDPFGMTVMNACPDAHHQYQCLCAAKDTTGCAKEQGWRYKMDPTSPGYNSDYGYWAPYIMMSSNTTPKVFVLLYNANEDPQAQIRRIIYILGINTGDGPKFGHVLMPRTLFRIDDGTTRGAGLSTDHWSAWTTNYFIVGGDERNVMRRLHEISLGRWPLQPSCALSCTATATPSSGAAPLTVSFSAQPSTSNCDDLLPYYSWTFDDGGASTEQSPHHTYAAAGTYNWGMTATLAGRTVTPKGTVAVCGLSCTASVPSNACANGPVPFMATVTASGCSGNPAFA